MSAPGSNLPIFVSVSVLSLIAAFCTPLTGTTEQLIFLTGYYAIALCFGIFVWSLFHMRKPLSHPIPLRALALPACGISAAWLWVISIEPFMFKIVADELLISSTAQMMHEGRLAGAARAANWNAGSFGLYLGFLDKRPLFHPFLISLAHDVSGYRVMNAMVLNALLTLLFLTGGFLVAAKTGGRWAGYVFLVLIAFFPVLAQGSTSGNASILNLTLLAGAILLGCRYYREPDKTSLAALVFCLLLLAQSRYESSIFILPFGILILAGWMKARQVILSPLVLTAPLFMILPVIHHRYTLEYSPFYWQAGPNERAQTFSLGYLFENLNTTWDFLFSLLKSQPNSIVLSISGITGLAILLVHLLRRRVDEPARTQLLLLTGLSTANIAVVLLFNYGVFTTYATSRLSLPMHFFMALFGAWAAVKHPRAFALASILLATVVLFLQTLSFDQLRWKEIGIHVLIGILAASAGLVLVLKHRPFASARLFAVLLVASILIQAPKIRSKEFFHGYTSPLAVDYFAEFARQNGSLDVIFLTQMPYLPALFRLNSAGSAAFLQSDAGRDALASGHYTEAFLFHIDLGDDTPTADPRDPGEMIPQNSALRWNQVSAKKLGPTRWARIYRIHLPDADPEETDRASADDLPPSPQ
jgi:hypothetical protein